MPQLPRTLLVLPAATALLALAGTGIAAAGTVAVQHGTAGGGQPAAPYLNRFRYVSQLSTTVPANGDVNPYGVAVVPASTGRLHAGDTLISNFNNKANVQGTGTTIVQVAPDGTVSQFARIKLGKSMSCPGGVGLTTALGILPGGWVVVGSLPTVNGGMLPAGNPTGCLIVLNNQGQPAETLTGQQINGPWDMTVWASGGHADLFVTNVLTRPAGQKGAPKSGLGTVIRIGLSLKPGAKPSMTGITVIGTGFPFKQNKAALIQGATGDALGPNGTLYVAETVTNSISAIPGATTRTTPVSATADVLTKGGALNGPLGLTWTPAGDLIAVNGNNGVAVEVSVSGKQVAHRTLIPDGAGDLFGLQPSPDAEGLLFVNDGTNALDLLSG